MRAPVRLMLVIAAIIVLHEVAMAMDGHGRASSAPALTCTEHPASHRTSHHPANSLHALASDPEPGSPADVATACLGLRAVAPVQRLASVDLDTTSLPPLLLPVPSIAELSAITSRSVVDHPPGSPPDVQRAQFQVYRI